MSIILFYSTRRTQKLDRIGAPGPAGRGHFWGFLTSILLQNIKKLKGPFGGKKDFQKKSHNVKKIERGPFSLARYCLLRWKRNNFYISVLCAKWPNLKPKSFVKLCWTILVSSCGLKKKSQYSRVSLHEAPTKNCLKEFKTSRILSTSDVTV